jgi:hypothetical protein
MMDRLLTGRAALLQKQIDELNQRIEELAGIGITSAADTPEEDQQRLAEFRLELEMELKTKRVVVLGTGHEYQMLGHKLGQHLRQRLSFLIERFAATKIMEEWTEGEPSVASELAKGPLKYKNVGTPQEAAFETYHCHPVNHPSHDGVLGTCEDAPSMSEHGPLDKQENRERRMLQNIQHEMESHNVGLFIVGLVHLHSMSMKLKEAGFNVAAYSWVGLDELIWADRASTSRL